MNNRLFSIGIVTLVAVSGFLGFITFESEVASAGTTWYVGSGPGNDSATIQGGIDLAGNGDTVFVYGDTYNENITINKSMNLTGENRDTTIIEGGGFIEVVYVNANWVNISGFAITNGDNGIYLEGADNVNISGNNISSNSGDGIYLHESNWTIISNNILFYNGWHDIDISLCIGMDVRFNNMIDSGIFIGGRKLEYWNTHTIDTTNILNGKPVYYWKNQTSGIIPVGAGQVILANCSNVLIQNQELMNSSIGIELGYSTNISIKDNNIKSSLGGIFIASSNNITIKANTASNNTWYGIYLYYSNDTTIFNNDIFNNEYGIRLSSSHMNNITSNNVSINNYALFCLQSENNNITHNNIFNNLDGVDILSSNYNYIINNTISSNINWGVFIMVSSNNSIYHNNIIGNGNQAFDNGPNQWDDGYPKGGNYWSDFNEPSEGAYDDYRGIDQNIFGSDGIIDNGTAAGGGKNPYVIDFDSQDEYPLIKPYGNYSFLFEGWNLISLPTIQPDTNLGAVVSSITGSYDAVQWYNTTNTVDHWKHNSTKKPPHLNDLDDIDHTMGFWIHITKPGGVLFKSPGNPPATNQQVPIYLGWNLVGYPSKSNKPRDTALNNINFGPDVNSIWTYNAEIQAWIEIGASENLTVGSGYWIHSIASGMLLWDVPL